MEGGVDLFSKDKPHALQVAFSVFGNAAKGAYYLVQVFLSLR